MRHRLSSQIFNAHRSDHLSTFANFQRLETWASAVIVSFIVRSSESFTAEKKASYFKTDNIILLLRFCVLVLISSNVFLSLFQISLPLWSYDANFGYFDVSHFTYLDMKRSSVFLIAVFLAVMVENAGNKLIQNIVK